jgi:TonB family protein
MLRIVCRVLAFFLLTAVAFGQGSAMKSCQSPTYPINSISNKPPIPPSSWRAPRSAIVGVDVTIDTKGKVKNAVVVSSGGNDADESVLQAVRDWTYTPATCGDVAFETMIHVKINLQVGTRSH